ncbi:MAG: hypothetical protein ACFCAD_08170 [Pleurocapsa sp.]
MEGRKQVILCDTNILIELYKNNPTIIIELRKIGVKQSELKLDLIQRLTGLG